MQDATRRAAHFGYVEEIDVTALDDLRVHLDEKRGASRGELTLLPFLVRAMVVALRDSRRSTRVMTTKPKSSPALARCRVGRRHPERCRPDGARGASRERAACGTAPEEIARLANAARNGKASR